MRYQNDTADPIKKRMAKSVMSVTKMQPQTIAPCEQTPREVLYLSEMDRLTETFVPILTVYEGCHREDPKNPAAVLRESLGKVLVHYYPLAGRLKKANDEDGPGEFEIDCNAKGVVFIEAEADCTLEGVEYFLNTSLPWETPLLSRIDKNLPLQDMPFLGVQVTRFKCGGFVVGMAYSHIIFDGFGFSQFMRAFAEIVKNRDTTCSVLPVWQRKLLAPRDPLQVNVPFDHVIRMNPNPVKYCSVTLAFSKECIDTLKREILRDSNGSLEYCSKFEALTSLIWQSYVRSWKIEDEMEYRKTVNDGFVFSMNMRRMLDPPLSEGYYGTCTCACEVKVGDTEISKRSDVVTEIRKVKEGVNDDYIRSFIDYCKAQRLISKEKTPVFVVNRMLFNDWSKFCYGEDLNGLGDAACTVMPAFPLEYWCNPFVLFLPPGARAPTGSAVVILPQRVMAAFKSLIADFNVQWID